MPTGYTDQITDTMTFAEWAMKCARAFGALITMRDDPSDAPIPDEFKPSPYHAENIAKAEARLAELRAMDAAAKEAGAAADHAKAMRSYENRVKESKATRARYERMLGFVRDWQPPTPDHVGMKDFMIQQIEESIRFDCMDGTREYDQPPVRLGPGDWYQRQVESAARDLGYHTEEAAKEADRCAMRTKWVRDLRASLEATPTT